MDALRNLPTPIKIGLPLILIALIMASLLMGTRGDGTTAIKTTKDPNQAAAWQWRLSEDKIVAQTKQLNTGEWEIRVPGTKAEQAKLLIEGGDISTILSGKSTPKCKEPGTFSSQYQQKRAENCDVKSSIYDQVMMPGVLSAKVSVNSEDSGALSGSDTLTKVNILLYLDPSSTKKVDAAGMAAAAANAVVGGDKNHVFIRSNDGETLWDGTAQSAATDTASATCGASDKPVDINTRETQLNDCKERKIQTKLTAIMGSADRVQVAVNVRLNPSSTSSVKEGSSASSATMSTTSTGESKSTTSKEVVPTVTTEKTDTLAGGISSISIAVTLDKKSATPDRVTAVRNILAGYIDPARDPQPTVTVVDFAGTSTTPESTATSAAPTNPSAASNDQRSPMSTSQNAKPGVPMSVWMIGMVALIGLIAMGMVLMRRNAKDAAQRAALEREVQQGQRMFQTFAADNPDHVAEDIMSLLGAPPSGRVPANN